MAIHLKPAPLKFDLKSELAKGYDTIGKLLQKDELRNNGGKVHTAFAQNVVACEDDVCVSDMFSREEGNTETIPAGGQWLQSCR